LNRQINQPPETRWEYLRQERERQIRGRREEALERDDAWNAEQALSYHTLQLSLRLQPGSAQGHQGCDVEQDMVLEQESDKEMVRKDTLKAGDEDIEIQQDAEMCMVSGPTAGEEILQQDTLTGEEEVDIKQDMEMMSTMDPASGEEMLGQDALALQPQARSQDVKHDQDEEQLVAILLESGEAESAAGEQNCFVLDRRA